MGKVIVTVVYGGKDKTDLSLPDDIPHQFLAEAVARALALPVTPQKQYILSTGSGDGRKPMSPAATLSSANVYAGSFLELTQEDISLTGASCLITDSGIRFPLQRENVVGRADRNDAAKIHIDLGPLCGKVISHFHATIRASGERFVLEDTRSTNGTWLNEAKLIPNQPYILKDGDVIDFGPRGKGVTVKYNEA